MKTWYTKKIDDHGDERIDRVLITDDDKNPVPTNLEWFLAPNDWKGNPNDKLTWFDKDMYRIPDEELVKLGKRKDNTKKRYYRKDNPNAQPEVVYRLDDELGDSFTDLPPLQGEDAPYQEWSEPKNTWVVNQKKKERGDKERRLGNLNARIRELEEKQARPLREKALGIVELDKDGKNIAEKNLLETQAEIEEIRPEKKKLEDELKKSA